MFSTKNNNLLNLLVALILMIMFSLTFFSMKDDSATMDELAHIPAGYAYLSQKDMRLNPEHPPLLKDLSAFPLLFMNLNFPFNHKSWTADVNGQWDFGQQFLYLSNNNPDRIILWSRIPLLFIMILLGIFVFRWTKELFGKKAGLLALILYAFSPNILAHGRYVTTDVGAAAAMFIASYYFIKWLKNPKIKNLIIASIIFGLAQLAKFSVFLLVPFFVLLTIIWIIILLRTNRKKYSFWHLSYRYLIGYILICLIALAVIGPIYQFHIWHYPLERQTRDIQFILNSYAGGPAEGIKDACLKLNRINRCPAEIIIWMSKKPILRSYAQYFFGLLMVFQRATGGNTTYFKGQVSAAGWKSYFPFVYLIKVPLAFHIMTLIVILWLIYEFFKRKGNYFQNFILSCYKHFTQISMLLFISLYWFVSLKSNLNIGLRHLLPIFPFNYVLVSGYLMKWVSLETKFPSNINNLKSALKKLENLFFLEVPKCIFVLLLVFWYLASSLSIWPHYLAYFNEIIGGPSNGYKYVVDSNLDWGQDLKRLSKWVEERNINKIYVDYFGGGSVEYYLGEKYRPWWGTRDSSEAKGWLAVSATFLQGGRGIATPGFNLPTGYYRWLDKYRPTKIIGYSIFVYKID